MKELFEIQQRLVSNKGNFNEFGKFSYRSLENILVDVKPLLGELKCTITFTDDMVLMGERYYVKSTVTLENENGEKKDAVAFAREDESRAGMCESQVTGTASSYARKYAICSLLAINEEQDPDSMDNRPKKAVNEPKISNMDILKTFYEQNKRNANINVEQLTKFKDFYKAKMDSWKGVFNPSTAFEKWMQRATVPHNGKE